MRASSTHARAVALASVVVVAAALALAAGFAGPASAHGRWLSGDLHTHSFSADGKNSLTEILTHSLPTGSLGYGLNYFANAEPGGVSKADPTGTKFLSPVWRWLTLAMYSYPYVQQAREDYPGDLVVQGLEWDVPTHDSATVGIVGAINEPAGISDFEYMFDSADADTSRAGESIPEVLDTTQPTPYPTLVPAQPMDKENVTAQDAINGAGWLEDRYSDSSYLFINHPSQKLLWGVGDFRALQDTAPDVVCGFEGLPGHQAAAARGGYGNYFDATGKMVPAGDPTIDQSVTDTARTYGGADYMTAKIGGVWDALLGEGRDWFVYDDSDYQWWTTQYKGTNPASPNFGVVFGAAYQDFWPGQYAKDWTYVGNKSYRGLVAGIKSGDSFIANGDLIRALQFKATAGRTSRTMGQTLTVSKGQRVTVTIAFKSPVMNNNGDKPRVNHVDLIGGQVTGLISPYLSDGTTPNPAYMSTTTNPTSHIVRTFARRSMHVVNGWTVVTVALKPTKSMYLRLRGTDLAPNTPNQTDAQGNPLIDTLTYTDQPNPTQDPGDPSPTATPWPQTIHINTPDSAWADLWFYANPIFIHVK